MYSLSVYRPSSGSQTPASSISNTLTHLGGKTRRKKTQDVVCIEFSIWKGTGPLACCHSTLNATCSQGIHRCGCPWAIQVPTFSPTGSMHYGKERRNKRKWYEKEVVKGAETEGHRVKHKPCNVGVPVSTC